MSKKSNSQYPISLPTDRTIFDPPPGLSRIRERSPLCRLRYPDGHVGWLVTSYELARSILRDRRFSILPSRFPAGETDPKNTIAAMKRSPETFSVVTEALCRHEAENSNESNHLLRRVREDPQVLAALRQNPPVRRDLLTLDPPHHTNLRKILVGQFTVRRVREYREIIEAIVDDRLAAMADAGPPTDFISSFALSVPSLVIGALLGARPEDRHIYERYTEIRNHPDSSIDQLLETDREFRSFLNRLIEQKKSEPSADILSHLIESKALSQDEVVDVSMVLFSTGHNTTARMLGLLLFAILHEPARWKRLHKDPHLIPNAIEEILRYLTLLQVGVLSRTALEDVEYEKTLIRKGESVTVSLSAANRDPQKFENPDHLNIRRDVSGHLAFGYGIHQCLGQHLARLEMQIAVAGLVRTFPTLRLLLPAAEVPVYSGDHLDYGVRSLPITW